MITYTNTRIPNWLAKDLAERAKRLSKELKRRVAIWEIINAHLNNKPYTMAKDVTIGKRD